MMTSHFSLSPARAGTTIAALCAALACAGCGKPAAAPAPAQVPEVGVYTVTPQALPMSTELPGRTAAYQVAEVRPQVGGLIQKRLFVEGADVKAGSTLYQIDAASYRAQYNSAKAALAKARANLLTSGPKAARYKQLLALEGVSRQDYDEALAAHEQARADVEAAGAALEVAAINLKYTSVSAPIGGRISRSSVTAGALVTASQAAPLATVQQLDPIYVDLSQSSGELLAMKRALEGGALKKGGGQARVSLLLADGSHYAEAGKLQFADVSVDPGTGNVALRALFPNPKGELLPGMYVRAVVENGVDEHAILVPQQGVTRNQKGQATALLLNRDNRVEQRILSTGAAIGDQWLVTAGLAAGERVIVEGLQKVKPGAPATAARPAAALAATAATGHGR